MVKKVILIVLGLILFIVGLAAAAVGGVALGFGGREGVIQSGFHHVSTPTNAFVSDPSRIRNRNSVDTGGSVAVRVDGRDSTKPLFIGVGPTSQVDAYLNGVSYDVVNDLKFGKFRMQTTRVNGTGQPAAPSDQSFWVASASGAAPRLNWDVTNGDYRVVVMNADASANVTLDARVGIRVKNLFAVGLGAVIGGGLLTLLGLALLVWGIVTKRKPEQLVGGYPGPYPPGGPSGGIYPPPYPTQPAYPPPTAAPPPAGVPPPSAGQVTPPPPAGQVTPPPPAGQVTPPPPAGVPPPSGRAPGPPADEASPGSAAWKQRPPDGAA